MLPRRAYPGDAGLDLAACEQVTIAPGERAMVGTGLAVAIPEGHAGLVIPRSGLAARHGISEVNAPGLIDSGYRGELKVILLNTDRTHAFTVEPGMRIAQLVVVPIPALELIEVDELPEAERGAAGFGFVGSAMRPEPRIRVSAILRWNGRDPAVPAREARAEHWLLPGGGVRSGESLTQALQRELAEETGIVGEATSCRSRARSRSSSRSRRSAASGRSTSSTSSSPATWTARCPTSSPSDQAVRGHRLFELDELEGIALHPPIGRFLRRWQPGEPCVYLGALWAP